MFLGCHRYDRRLLAEQGHRNGCGRPRPVVVETWPIEVRAPRIRDLPAEAPAFHSAILPRRWMLSAETQRLLARLCLEGLSSGDFEPAFREFLGERVPVGISNSEGIRDSPDTGMLRSGFLTPRQYAASYQATCPPRPCTGDWKERP